MLNAPIHAIPTCKVVLSLPAEDLLIGGEKLGEDPQRTVLRLTQRNLIVLGIKPHDWLMFNCIR
jgi:hypothetical protein